ncbi:hypothetical protein BGW36DRAFT_59134 [Talaromyces proteolyticus]|uniref:Zn(2)-C6 fungal-type domain-containing protein n=1 Tax=Talaromyces proteolyticus TaxID=1131652 RepID=A0AAD4PVV3_9EURO|nr:uncharacterized protein BGW36DRAFT_59134 [Talaromyces proteolyticus]KAH8690730.1 hypothetical protein BGW36DRAFT_59134 [Talaromyces proteolyticus]
MMDPPCQTCRSRRKACDRSRPKCQTCIKANRQCGGYSSRRNKVFVNIDSHSIKAPKKPIIGKAITLAKQNRESSTHAYSHASFHCTSLHILDLPAVDFQSHFTTLWTQFNEKYGRTSDVWSAGLMKLGLQNQALDLALISLATMRLSISERRGTYLVFSLSAYSVSLRIFRQLLQDSRQKRYPSNLVVTSLIFTLFEGSQQTPTRIYKSGWAGHLKGTLALMQGQSPESFQEEGLLAAFKRIREMAV